MGGKQSDPFVYPIFERLCPNPRGRVFTGAVSESVFLASDLYLGTSSGRRWIRDVHEYRGFPEAETSCEKEPCPGAHVRPVRIPLFSCKKQEKEALLPGALSVRRAFKGVLSVYMGHSFRGKQEMAG